jgi:hypothetical protein
MTVPGAAPPPEALKGGPRQIGPFTATAQLGVGRRTIALVGHRDPAEGPLVLREMRVGVDVDVFEAEVRAQRAFDSGPEAPDVLRLPQSAVSFGRLAVGESVATILEQAISQKKPVDLDIALAIAMGIAHKLAKTGERRCHCDLVPHHAIVGYDGSIHLIDAAPTAHRERIKALSRIGYRAPEHIRGELVGPQADVFMLGILLFEMTTASRLFGMSTARDADSAIIEGRLPRPRDLVGDTYPIELQLVLRKLLRPAPAGRFTDGATARDALRLVAAARTEITQAQIGAWLKRVFADRYASWRGLVPEAAVLEAEDAPISSAQARPSSRAATRRASAPIERADTIPRIPILPDKTEPGLPMPRHSGVRDRPSERRDTELRVPLRPLHQDGPTLVTNRLILDEDDDEEIDDDDTHSEANQPAGAARLATKLALEGIETLDDNPRSARHESPLYSEIKATPMSSREAVYNETPTPLMEVELQRGAIVEAKGARVQIEPLMNVGPLERATVTPTPLVDVEPDPTTGQGQAVPSAAQRLPTPEPLESSFDHLFELALEAAIELTDSDEHGLHADAEARARAPTHADHLEFGAPILTDEGPPLEEEHTDAGGSPSTDDRTIDDAAPSPSSLEDGVPLPHVRVARARAPSNVASDLLLPDPPPLNRAPSRQPDLASDLLDADPAALEESQHTIRAAVPKVDVDFEGNDTLDEIGFDVLPSGVVAKVLEDADESENASRNAMVPPPPLLRSPNPSPPTGTAAPARPNAKAASLGVAPLWRPAQERFDADSPFSQANVPTQIVRERIVSNVALPQELRSDPGQDAARNGKATPQSRVPTLVVRERSSASASDSGDVRVSDPISIGEDASRESLVIPIPDDELDRAARRRKAAFVATIIVGAALMLVATGLILFTMFENDIRLDARTLSTESAPRKKAAAGATPRATLGTNDAVARTASTARAGAYARSATAARAIEERRFEPVRGGPPHLARFHISVRPHWAKIAIVGGAMLPNDSDVEVHDKPIEISISAPGYQELRVVHQPGDDSPVNVLLKKKRLR